MPLDVETIRRIPKVCLHEHIDGGMRPATIIEIAGKEGIDLPTKDPRALGEWFRRGAQRGSLPLYLEGFRYTIAALQTEEALERAAFEALEDFARENVVYAELRFHPGFHTQKGLTVEDVMAATAAGCRRARERYGIEWGLIVCAMRNMDPKVSLEMAELAVDWRDRGAVGFDLAGEEAGHPPKKHVEAFQYCQRQNFNITIHAGEAFGQESIWQALQWCGAHRLGHATRLTDDLAIQDGKIVRMGRLAQYVLDHRIPLEICLLSNVHTAAAPSLEAHPFPVLYRYKFRVNLNTDDRLMSGTSMTTELKTAVDAYGLTFDDLEKITINSMKSAFIPYKRRCALIYNQIKAGFQKIRTELEP